MRPCILKENHHVHIVMSEIAPRPRASRSGYSRSFSFRAECWATLPRSGDLAFQVVDDMKRVMLMFVDKVDFVPLPLVALSPTSLCPNYAAASEDRATWLFIFRMPPIGRGG